MLRTRMRQGIRRMGSAGDACPFIRMSKNCFSDEVTLEQRSKRKDGKRNMDIWGKTILEGETLRFNISQAEAGSM